jgi:hypothetical protein
MVKIRQGNESTVIFVGAPNSVYGDHGEARRLYSMVENKKDTVYIEFYDVLSEENFDPKVKQEASNLKLLASKRFEVKDLTFDKDMDVDNFSVLMPVQSCKKAAELIFGATFQPSVSPDF